ncbi:aromatic pathway regulator [Anopheles sinensis]|uniref:Aromatic pathway regulator n=1 Tax=Anopheles sinensis TaxID=74873 RepID=A0A084VPH6_ANOSI|nr:aromatic pathway regulator [Anopheles sinensis]
MFLPPASNSTFCCWFIIITIYLHEQQQQQPPVEDELEDWKPGDRVAGFRFRPFIHVRAKRQGNGEGNCFCLRSHGLNIRGSWKEISLLASGSSPLGEAGGHNFYQRLGVRSAITSRLPIAIPWRSGAV